MNKLLQKYLPHYNIINFRALVTEIACETFGVEKKMDFESLVPDQAKKLEYENKGEWLEQPVMVADLCHVV